MRSYDGGMRIHSEPDELGNPVGKICTHELPAKLPGNETLSGRLVRLERLTADKHASELYACLSPDAEGTAWTYMLNGPYDNENDFTDWVKTAEESVDPHFYAIIDNQTGAAIGYCSYLRIEPKNGVIEVGNINYSIALKRSAKATEAMYLLAKNAFELGYRRYEWKCNALNAPSIAAAERLGFSFEGVFRNAIVIKGRNRDTAWFAFTDEDWVGIRSAMETWLDESNFDADGKQFASLKMLTSATVRSRWPHLKVEISEKTARP